MYRLQSPVASLSIARNEKVKYARVNTGMDVNPMLSDTPDRPAVGVLCRKYTVNKLLKNQTVPVLSALEAANHVTRLMLFYFSIQDVDLKRRTIQGVHFNNQNKIWEKREFPYPDFLYRKSGRSRRNEDLFIRFEEQLKALKIETLNHPKRFDKWEVYYQLSQDKEILPYLPLTLAYKTPGDLTTMLDHAGKVYLKGFAGGRGRRIICAARLPGGGYEYKYFTDRLYIFKTNNITKLIQGIVDFYKEQNFLIQEAVDLIRIGNRLVDMRAEVQRGKNGELMVVAIPVRVGLPDAPITAHADAYPFEDFFQNFMSCSEVEAKNLKSKIIQFLVSVYKAMEKAFGPMVEIGMDCGLDKHGRLWLLECNSRSRMVSLHKAYDENTINKTGLNILEYAEFRYREQLKGKLMV